MIRRFAPASFFAVIAVAPALAQPADPPADKPPKFLTLDRLDMFLEAEGEFLQTRVRYDKRSRDVRGRSQTDREWILREGVGLRLGGSVIDPSVLSYDGQVTFSLTQSRFTEDRSTTSKTDSQSGHLLDYDMRLNFFEGRDISGSVYARRQDDRVVRRFQPTLDERRTGYGTSWYYAHPTIPMELSYDYLKTDRRGNRRQLDDEHFEERTLHYGLEWIISDWHRIKFSYEHAENDQNYQGRTFSYETTRDLFIVDQSLEFGDEKQHEYRTLIHWQEETGDFARDFFEIGPQLRIRLTDDLNSYYKYQFNREKYAGLDIETHRADFQLVHQLYSNLTTTFDLFGLYEEVEDDVNTTQYGASVDWQYNRRNPYGHFYANLSLYYDTEDFDGETGKLVVLDESATFRDPLPITLRNLDVIDYSIIMTDATNRRIFVRGLDYIVTRRRDVTQITRLYGGRIADRETVLIDYQYRVPTDGKIDTLRVDFNLEQQFKNGLTPYYRFSFRNQELDHSTGIDRRADRTDHHRMGVRFERPEFSLSGEFEIFDDTIESYNAFHLDGIWHVWQAQSQSLDATSRFSQFFFDGDFDRRDVSIVDVELDHRWSLRDDLSLFERVLFRWQDDTAVGYTIGWDAVAGVEYAIGDFTAQVTIEYDRLELPGSDEDNLGLYVNLRREFPNVLSRR